MFRLESLPTIVLLWQLYSVKQKSDNSQAKSKIHRARIASPQMLKIVNKTPINRAILFVETITTRGRSVEDNEQLYTIYDRSVPVGKILSPIDTTSSQTWVYVESHKLLQNIVIEKAEKLSANSRKTVTNRSEWGKPWTQILCYQYYEIDNHILPKCLAEVNNMILVTRISKHLTYKQNS